ncbi:MAG: 2-phosphosulfolactate phosphatase [Actinomycetota bacterium]|nr:2-phosphosulfolactate phosphatase [Actinomycetota bacterium]
MIDVALTRAGLRRADVAVVIDVLRATSTATQALATGYRRVMCVETVEQAARLRAPGQVLAGERRWVKPAGFDQGNSPLEAMHRLGDEIILATTNGTPTIVAASRYAPTVLLACLTNLDAVIDALRAERDPQQRELQLVCSGTDNAPALEDVYLAGRLCSLLDGDRTDAARVAVAVAAAYATPVEALTASAGAVALRTAGLDDDIAYCARESTLDTVPRVLSASTGIAVLGHHAVTTGDQRQLQEGASVGREAVSG